MTVSLLRSIIITMSTVKGSSLPLTTLFRYVYRNSLEELEQVITVDDFMQGITKKKGQNFVSVVLYACHSVLCHRMTQTRRHLHSLWINHGRQIIGWILANITTHIIIRNEQEDTIRAMIWPITIITIIRITLPGFILRLETLKLTTYRQLWVPAAEEDTCNHLFHKGLWHRPLAKFLRLPCSRRSVPGVPKMNPICAPIFWTIWQVFRESKHDFYWKWFKHPIPSYSMFGSCIS